MDQFLRDLISQMDQVKESLFVRADSYGAAMEAFFRQFCSKVDDFVKHSVELIRKYPRLTSSEPMRDYQDLKKSHHLGLGDDPLSREIDLFKKKREQADMIENIFRTIRNHYTSTDIAQMKAQIERRFSLDTPIYSPVAGANYFARLRQEFASKAQQLPEFQQNLIVASFSLDPQQQARPVSATPAQAYLHPSSTLGSPQPPAHSSSLQPSYLDPASKPSSERNIGQNPKPSPSTHQSASTKPTPVSASPGAQAFESAKLLIQPGAKPLAKVSPERNEIQITYDIEDPKLELVKNYGLGSSSSQPTTFRALDDRNLVVGFEDGTLKVMDLVASGEIKRQLKLSSKIVCIESFEDSPGNNPLMALLCGTGAPDHAVVHLELQARETVATKFRGHAAEVTSVCPLGRGDFVSGGHDGQVIYWNIAETKFLAAKQAHNAKITSMCTLNLNQTLVTGSSDCSMNVYHLSQRDLLLKNTLKEAHPITLVSSFYGNCKFALSCLETGTIRIWNVEDAE